MTREEVIRLALEAGVADRDLSREGQAVTDYGDATDALERFAALVAAAEREACAKICERRAEDRFHENGTCEFDTGATYYGGRCGDEYETRDEEDHDCAAAIRARGQKGGAV